MALKAVAFNCTLKPSNEPSSTEILLKQVSRGDAPHGVEGELFRIVDHDIKPGVTSDEGPAMPGRRSGARSSRRRSSFSARRSGSPAVKRVQARA
jgi:hypothetical protein